MSEKATLYKLADEHAILKLWTFSYCMKHCPNSLLHLGERRFDV
jgi:hypothetical protein